MHSGLIPRILTDYSVQRRDGRLSCILWLLFKFHLGFLFWFFFGSSRRDAPCHSTVKNSTNCTRIARPAHRSPFGLLGSWLRASPAVHRPAFPTEAPQSEAATPHTRNAHKLPIHTLTHADTLFHGRFSGVTGFSRLRRLRQFQPHLAHCRPMSEGLRRACVARSSVARILLVECRRSGGGQVKRPPGAKSTRPPWVKCGDDESSHKVFFVVG